MGSVCNNAGKPHTLKEKLASIGPSAVIVGSFIGPGTVVTATRAGAGYGYTLLWTIVFSFIAVMVLQGMSAKLGIITQKGLAENILTVFEDKPLFKKALVYLISIALSLGGLAYAGGDLTGTAIGLSTITGIPSHIIAPFWGIVILLIVSFRDIKWLEYLLSACVGFMALVFVITMFVLKPDMTEVLKGLVPTVPQGSLIYCLSLIGTTIGPQNIFIHSVSAKKTWHNPSDISLSRFDIGLTMTVGAMITIAVLVTAGTSLFGHSVQSAADIAIQLEPLLGSFAKVFLSLGLVAAGFSSAVITPLGVSYVLGGFFGWDFNRKDKRFLWTNIIVIAFGIIIAATGYNPLSIIIAAQAFNGAVLPIVVVTLVYITSKKSVLGEHTNNPISVIVGTLIGLVTIVLGITSIVSLF